MTTINNILDQAKELINGNRAKTYGNLDDNYKNIALFWSAYLKINLHPKDVAIMMMLMKAARTKSGIHHHDNFVDAAGYAAIAGYFSEKEAKAQRIQND